MHASELWEGRSFWPRLARYLLLPFSILYGMGWIVYLGIYKAGWKKAKRPHSPVLCVGNLVSGGSGKTPVTLYLARLLQKLGYEVVVSCSGYGSPASEAARVAPTGLLSAKEWGDEAALFRWTLSDLPLIVGRRRVLAAELCHREFPNAVLLLDDGFQHLPLAKDLTIILDPPFPKNGFCLPAGPYREPWFYRDRVDLILPGDFSIEEEASLIDPSGQPRNTEECTLLCALAQPDKVVATLAKMGTTVVEKVYLPDHDPLTGGTLISGLPKGRPVVVTAKDWVKLRERADVGERDFLIVKHAVRIEPEDRFEAWLQQRLHGIQAQSHPQ